MVRCDDLFPQQKTPTYVNEALNQKSQIDFLISLSCVVDDFVVLDPDINFSDLVPLVITVKLSAALKNLRPAVYSKRAAHNQIQLRWDKADLNSF